MSIDRYRTSKYFFNCEFFDYLNNKLKQPFIIIPIYFFAFEIGSLMNSINTEELVNQFLPIIFKQQ